MLFILVILCCGVILLIISVLVLSNGDKLGWVVMWLSDIYIVVMFLLYCLSVFDSVL